MHAAPSPRTAAADRLTRTTNWFHASESEAQRREEASEEGACQGRREDGWKGPLLASETGGGGGASDYLLWHGTARASEAGVV